MSGSGKAGPNRVRENTAMSDASKIAVTNRVRKNTAMSRKSNITIARFKSKTVNGKLRKGSYLIRYRTFAEAIPIHRQYPEAASKVDGWSNTKEWNTSKQYQPQTTISMRVIPCLSDGTRSSVPRAALLSISNAESKNCGFRIDAASGIVSPEKTVATNLSGIEEIHVMR